MDDYVSVFRYKDNVGISFDVEAEKPFRVGEQMNAAHAMAYMNGYNWAARAITSSRRKTRRRRRRWRRSSALWWRMRRRRAAWCGSTVMTLSGTDRP